MPSLRPMALLAVVAASACVPASEPETAESIQLVQPPPQCTQEECGGPNSPVIDGVPFWDLNSNGAPNDHGVAILDVRRGFDNAEMKLIADGDMLRGIHPVTSAPMASGIDLINTRITVVAMGKLYEIRIGYVSPSWAVDEWFWIPPYHRVEAYELYYTPMFSLVRNERPLCSAGKNDPTVPKIRAIAFTGDKYDADHKTVSVGGAAVGWMNIACWMSLPYKLHLLGHTTAANNRLAIATPAPKRQALMRAISMSPCASGTSYTTPGTLITMHESQNLLPPASDYLDPTARYEAIWNASGAVCLSWQRKATSDEDYKLRRAAIENDCGHTIPECDPLTPVGWTAYGSVLTGVPP